MFGIGDYLINDAKKKKKKIILQYLYKSLMWQILTGSYLSSLLTLIICNKFCKIVCGFSIFLISYLILITYLPKLKIALLAPQFYSLHWLWPKWVLVFPSWRNGKELITLIMARIIFAPNVTLPCLGTTCQLRLCSSTSSIHQWAHPNKTFH